MCEWRFDGSKILNQVIIIYLIFRFVSVMYSNGSDGMASHFHKL